MIRPVRYAEILDDPNAPALLREYDEECSPSELGRANPQRKLYELMERSGGFQAFGVYNVDFLVGFASLLMYSLPHFGKRVATTESIFLTRRIPTHENGLDFIAYLEHWSRRQGCTHFIKSAPVGSRFDKLLSVSDEDRHTSNVYIMTL